MQTESQHDKDNGQYHYAFFGIHDDPPFFIKTLKIFSGTGFI
jgi:hypothetical protein